LIFKLRESAERKECVRSNFSSGTNAEKGEPEGSTLREIANHILLTTQYTKEAAWLLSVGERW
jgi:hypothetical protein